MSMRIDFHTHIFPESVVRDRDGHFDDTDFGILYSSPKARMATAGELLSALDENGIDAAVVMGFPWADPDRLSRHNEYLLESAHASGGRIIPFRGLSAKDADEVDRDIGLARADGFLGIGEISFYSEGLGAESVGLLSAILSAAREAALPVCLHVNEPVGHFYAGKYASDFAALYEAIRAVRGHPVVLAHWGGGILFYELMPEVREAFEGVYYDTAASPFLYRDDIYMAARSIVGAGKILFASDYPLTGYARYLDAIEAAPFFVEEKRAVLGENACKLLGLRGLAHE